MDRSAEATEGEVKALRAVAGSLSWVARQCPPDEAGTASTLQGSVSRAVVKDLSDANRAVNRLKQTEDVGILIHAIPLGDLRTVSISDAALDLDRPDGSTQGGFMVGFTTSELHQQGSAVVSSMSWSSHKVCIRDGCLSALVCWWKQYHGTATFGTDCLDRRNRDNCVWCVLVNWPQYHDIGIVVRESETEDPQ